MALVQMLLFQSTSTISANETMSQLLQDVVSFPHHSASFWYMAIRRLVLEWRLVVLEWVGINETFHLPVSTAFFLWVLCMKGIKWTHNGEVIFWTATQILVKFCIVWVCTKLVLVHTSPITCTRCEVQITFSFLQNAHCSKNKCTLHETQILRSDFHFKYFWAWCIFNKIQAQQ